MQKIKLRNKIIALLLSVSLLLGILGLTIQAQVMYNTEEVTVYITVTDITDYNKPINILVPRRKLTVTNFNVADYGDTLIGLTAVEGVTYLHALVQLHKELYGEEAVDNKLMLTDFGYVRYFMGKSVANVLYKNGNDIFAYPNMINLKDGDELQICLYDESRSQAVSTFSQSRIDEVAVDELLNLQLFQHYSYPRNKRPLRGAEICYDSGIYVTDANGDIVKTDKNGNFSVSFPKPGLYTISAMPQIDYYMSEQGGQIIVQYVPKEVTTVVEKTIRTKIGEKTTIHNPLDLTDPDVFYWFVLYGDYSKSPVYEAETGTITGTCDILTDGNNSYGFDTSKLSGNSAVILSPGASINIPITVNTVGDWTVYWEGQSLSADKQTYYISIDDTESKKWSYIGKSKPDGNIELNLNTGLHYVYPFETTGQHFVTIKASENNTASILVDRLVYGENVTSFSPSFSQAATVSWNEMWNLYFDEYIPNEVEYGEPLTPEDAGYVSELVDLRPNGVTTPYITSKEDVYEEHIVTETITETVLEKVETIVPMELFHKISYTTPMLVINVSGEVIIDNPELNMDSTSSSLTFNAKNLKLIEEDYTCYVTTYDENDVIVEVEILSSLKDKGNYVAFSKSDFSYIKIFCWTANMKPLCSAKVVSPNEVVEKASLDWDYTMSYNEYDTYITTPTKR